MHPSRPRTVLARAIVMALLTALGLLGVAAGPAAAADASWEVGPAAGDFGSGRPNYSYTLNPGGRLTDGLVVTNHGTTPLRLAVYAADGFTNAGRLDLVAKNARSTRVGAWVRPGRTEVTVGPGVSVEVPFTVTLPGNAAPGDYMGGIVTSPAQPGETNRRLGVRIRLRVGGAITPRLSVENLRVRYAGTPNPFGKGDATVSYTIRNTGNALLTARQSVSLSGPFGRWGVRAGGIPDSPQLLPGDAWKVSVPVRGVAPTLRLTGTVTLVPLLTDAAGSVAPLATVESTTHAWTTPWALLLFLFVLCVLVAVGLASWRRRRAERRDRQPDEHEVREPETSDQ
jgi:hypothetical protein